MSVATKNAKVLAIEERLGSICETVLKMLAKIDPNAVLIFAQAHEIEHLQARNLALGFILAHVEHARQAVLKEFMRLQGDGVWVDPEAIEAIRACLAEENDGGGNGGGR